MNVCQRSYRQLSTNLSALFSAVLVTLALAACTPEPAEKPLTLTVQSGAFTLAIPATGELEAVNETAISVPGEVMEAQVLAWLAEENAFVQKDEVVARLDPLKYQRDVESQLLKQEQVEVAIVSKQAILHNEQRDIRGELALLESEQAFAKEFAIDDLRVYSRNDIIDKLANVEYLNARREFQYWRQQGQSKKAQGELELLSLEQQQAQQKLQLAEKILHRLEVRAPHAGIFVLVANWNGRKPRVGETMWPGRKFAVIPDLSKMQAKVYVLEAEAAGLAVGLKVALSLDAQPQQIYQGQVSAVDGVASSRRENDPVKSFAVTVTLDDHAAALPLPPGAQIHARIEVLNKPSVLSVPAQALLLDAGAAFVWCYRGQQLEKCAVKTGVRSLTRVEILEGLSAGDEVLLQPPTGPAPAAAPALAQAKSQRQSS